VYHATTDTWAAAAPLAQRPRGCGRGVRALPWRPGPDLQDASCPSALLTLWRRCTHKVSVWDGSTWPLYLCRGRGIGANLIVWKLMGASDCPRTTVRGRHGKRRARARRSPVVPGWFGIESAGDRLTGRIITPRAAHPPARLLSGHHRWLSGGQSPRRSAARRLVP